MCKLNYIKYLFVNVIYVIVYVSCNMLKEKNMSASLVYVFFLLDIKSIFVYICANLIKQKNHTYFIYLSNIY